MATIRKEKSAARPLGAKAAMSGNVGRDMIAGTVNIDAIRASSKNGLSRTLRPSAAVAADENMDIENTPKTISEPLNSESKGIVCFVAGTMIATKNGEVAVEDLYDGCEVLTMDNGFQPVRWIGATTVAPCDQLAPIQIAAGALNNECALLVSPHHRMLVKGWGSDELLDDSEVLVPAKMLMNDTTITQVEDDEVTYFQILFDQHEIVFAQGCPSESFHPGRAGFASTPRDVQEQVFTLFPYLRFNVENYGPTARISVKPPTDEETTKAAN